MRYRSTDFDPINAEALSVSRPSVVACFPTATRGPRIFALNPRRGDRRLGSFKINLRTGRWADFRAATKDAIPSASSPSSKTADRARLR